MTKKHISLLALPVLLAAALLFHTQGTLLADTGAAPAAEASAEKASRSSLTLFPDFNADSVTAVSIITPQANFDLRRIDDRCVSVNGQRGDSEVFVTLLEQIADMTVVAIDAFPAQDAPLLTLAIQGEDTTYTAVFYGDGSTGERARIVSRTKDAAVYAETDGWRIGTLMLACEGMRVQDALGKETPME